MFRTESQTDQPAWEPLKEWEAGNQSNWKRGEYRGHAAEDGPDQTILDQKLHPLRHLGWPGPPGLYEIQIRNRQSIIA